MNQFAQQRRRRITVMLVCLPISFLLALYFGSTAIDGGHFWAAFFSTSEPNHTQTVVTQIRLPRALLAALVGAILGISGATTQGLFRNPLADPSLIGVTAGASAGAAVVIFLMSDVASLSGLWGLSLVSAGAFVGGASAVVLVYRIATKDGVTSVATMLLAGIAITALAGGLSSLTEYFANNDMLRRISLWRMGGLDGANAERVLMAIGVASVMLLLLPRFSTALNALLLGESEARHLGISVQRTKSYLVVLVALGVATSVALAGTIAFVGLVVPHIVRLLLGPDHRYLLPMSAVAGAILLLLADCVSRTVLAPVELPVGLVTAFLGAPFFISLLRQREQMGWR